MKSEDGTAKPLPARKMGLLKLKDFCVGKYTVTEIANKASEDYIIPDGATVEIKADETATVQFFNEKPEKTGNTGSP